MHRAVLVAQGTFVTWAVSHRFVALSQRKIRECLSRRLDDLDLWVVMIDGIGFADHMALIALGISQEGRKHLK